MIINWIFFPFVYPTSVKKEEAENYVKFRSNTISVILILNALLMGVLQWLFSSKLLSMYLDFGVPVPAVLRNNSITTMVPVAFFVIVAVLLAKQPVNPQLSNKLKNYKNGTMININQLIDKKKEFVLLIQIIFMVCWITYSTILPIYDLTELF